MQPVADQFPRLALTEHRPQQNLTDMQTTTVALPRLPPLVHTFSHERHVMHIFLAEPGSQCLGLTLQGEVL